MDDRWTFCDVAGRRFAIVPWARASRDERRGAVTGVQARGVLSLAFTRGFPLGARPVLERLLFRSPVAHRARALPVPQIVTLLLRELQPGGRLLLLRDPMDARPAAPAAVPLAAAPDPLTSPGAKAARGTLSFTLIESHSEKPLCDVALDMTGPGGETKRVVTDRTGSVVLTDLERGECHFRSDVRNAFVSRAYAPGSASGIGEGDEGRERAPIAGPSFLVDVDEHRLRTGDTPDEIAATWGVSWPDIARFNWGTTDEAELEDKYRDELGCRRRGGNGRYVFDDLDDPGVVLIPRPWEATLTVGTKTTVFVRSLRTVFISAENERGIKLPAARFSAWFSDGHERTGRTGNRGVARVVGVPEGPFTVSFPHEDELLASSLAASVRRAFDEQIAGPLFTLLMQEASVVSLARRIYESAFNDLTGRGLAADIDQVVTDPEARAPLLALCAMSGIEIEGVTSVSIVLPAASEGRA